MRRRALIVGLLGVALVAGVGIWLDRRSGDDRVDVPIFEPARSFCSEFDGKPFVDQVDGVERSSGGLVKTVARVEAGFLRQTASTDGVPDEAKELLVRLADQVVDASASGDWSDAERTAAALDAIGRERCR